MRAFPPRRIVCLTEETVETLYLLGEDARIAADLVRRGVAVHAFNQRDLAGILAMIETLGALVGAPEKGARLAAELRARVAAVAARMRDGAGPRIYFEEWDEPMIAGIQWVSQLLEAAGGSEVFPELARRGAAKERIVTAEQVIAARPGFAALPAVRDGFLREVKSALILQPGPAALTNGLDALAAIVGEWRAARA